MGGRTPVGRNEMRFALLWDDVTKPITQLGQPLKDQVIAPLLPGVMRAGCWLRKSSQRLVAAVTITLFSNGRV